MTETPRDPSIDTTRDLGQDQIAQDLTQDLTQDLKGSEIWQAALRLLEQVIVPNQLKTWIQPLAWISADPLEDNSFQVTLAAPNDFSANWVNDHFLETIEDSLEKVIGSRCSLVLLKEKPEHLLESPQTYSSVESHIASETYSRSDANMASFGSAEIPSEKSRFGPATIDPRYTFDNFVVGASNQFAHASAVAIADRPGRQYNPLFLYSPPGLGKTHLLHAIGNHVKSMNPDARVFYTSAESFMNDLIDSIQRNKMPAFREKYRSSYDVLLIDDIQFIAGKGKTEEEFFHTFNALYGTKRQIVLTSDRSPKEIEGLEERIRTRFEWGLVADIQVPEIETRIAILKTKAELDDIYLPDEVSTHLATHIKSNVRELEGILIRLQAQASLTGSEISLEMAKAELKNILPAETSTVSVEMIQNIVAKHFNLKVQNLKSPVRAKTVALPRQIAMYLTRKYTNLGYKEIGNQFGKKDHTTILHAFKKIEKGYEQDPSLRQVIEEIQNQL